jgi:mRNA-degrading endonuclease RelE of RelBE toxin-antitoxin system
MTEYHIGTTKQFDKDFSKLDNSVKVRIEDEIEQLAINPYVGRPLGYKFFREKKVDKFRFYYLIYEDHVVVFLIAISEKKDQQKTIDTIKHLIPHYKEFISKKFTQKK